MRQDQKFPAQVELLLYDKPVRLWRLISENETKCSNFEQNGSTKSPKAVGVRIVLERIWFGREKFGCCCDSGQQVEQFCIFRLCSGLLVSKSCATFVAEFVS